MGLNCLLGKLTTKEFDYAALDDETKMLIQGKTGEIKSLIRRTAQDIIDIGQKLITVKKQLGHGQFRVWLKSEFDWSLRTAARYMQVASSFKDTDLANLNIAVSTLYLLAEPSTPIKAQEKVIEVSKQGENISYSKARDIVKQYKEDKEAGINMASKACQTAISNEDSGDEKFPTAILSPLPRSLETQIPNIINISNDKSSGYIIGTAENLEMNSLYRANCPQDDSSINLSKNQPVIDMLTEPMVGNLIYLTNHENEESILIGKIAEVNELDSCNLVIRITLQ
jgi:hypothetical protein